MDVVETELRELSQSRRQVAAELALLFVVSVASLEVVPAVVAAGPEARTVFLALVAGFSLATVRTVGRLLALLDAECPRCAETFHGAGWPGSCASCGLGLRDRGSR